MMAYRWSILWAIVAMATACDPKPAPVSPPDDGDAAPAVLPPIDDPKYQAIAAQLPSAWTGFGVIQEREAPSGAPDWVAVGAELVEEEGMRYLQASGIVKRISNPALARNAAAARARAELARWLGTDVLVGTEVTEHWSSLPGQLTAAKVRIRVGDTWQPGQPYTPPQPSDDAEPPAGGPGSPTTPTP